MSSAVWVLVVLAALAGTILHARMYPYAACVSCDGSGKHRGASGRVWRSCSRCHGKGRRRRALAAMFGFVERDEAE